ncbi:MAG: Gfo/Idh/MocA family protein, partial [Pirellulaceae bacterium]
GVIGIGSRGTGQLVHLLAHNENVVIPAICDIKPEARARGVATVKQYGGNTPEAYGKDEYDYRNLIARDDIDGIVVVTDVQWLGKISIDGLKAGKHVGADVTGTHSLQECFELVQAAEASKGRYMLMENCCYGRETLLIMNMVRAGVFGETYSGVGSYIHDCRSMYFDADGNLTWRGHLVRDDYGCNYPSHAIGSPAKWMGINDGDCMVSLTATMTEPRGLHDYAVKRFGADSPQAKIDFKSGDITTVTIRTANGQMLRIDCGLSSTRPYSRYYLLQGLNGCYDSRTGIYVHESGAPEDWQGDLIAQCAAQYEHEYYRKDSETAAKAGGHGGIDYFVVREYVEMVREDKEPWIDAYDAAAWTSIMHLSRESIDKQGAPVEIPDFTGGRWKDPDWRQGRLI